MKNRKRRKMTIPKRWMMIIEEDKAPRFGGIQNLRESMLSPKTWGKTEIRIRKAFPPRFGGNSREQSIPCKRDDGGPSSLYGWAAFKVEFHCPIRVDPDLFHAVQPQGFAETHNPILGAQYVDVILNVVLLCNKIGFLGLK